MTKQTSAITIGKFVDKLTAGGGVNPSPADCMEYGLKRSWLEPSDVARKEEALLRKEAARIVHNFLRLELSEADELDGSPAYVLQDLFDCRVCAGHIIQVYVKGVMEAGVLPDGRLVFDADKPVSEEEAQEILVRMFRTKKRMIRTETKAYREITTEPEEISPEQALQYLQEKGSVLLADVRSARDYEEDHLKGSVNVPLLDIIKNPFVFSGNRDKMLLLYCNEGCQSKAAAQCLLEAGYENVFFFAWKEGKQ